MQKRSILLNILNNNDFFIITDSTTDALGRSILALMIGVLEKDFPSDIFLLEVVEMDNCKASDYYFNLRKILEDFFGQFYDTDRLKLIITDRAPVMIKAGILLKETFQKTKHVTCLVHLLHNVCNKLREKSPNLDNVVSLFKKLLLKNKDNQSIFSETTDLSLPKLPILIRFGSWLSFVCFIYENYKILSTFLEKLDDKYNSKHSELFNSKIFEDEIEFCYHYKYLISDINFLETHGLSIFDQLNVIRRFLQDNFNASISEYFQKSLDNNPDIDFFMNLNRLRSNNDLKCYNYAPLTSVSAERLFSGYRFYLDDQRQSFTIENLNSMLFLYFNKTL